MSDSLADPLRVAVAAAREAGALIREEFHRPGGPRGQGSHADIDVIAEGVIRRILLEAYPDDPVTSTRISAKAACVAGSELAIS